MITMGETTIDFWSLGVPGKQPMVCDIMFRVPCYDWGYAHFQIDPVHHPSAQGKYVGKS